MMSAVGTKRTSGDVRYLVANGGKADMTIVQSDFRFLTLNGHPARAQSRLKSCPRLHFYAGSRPYLPV